MVGVCSLGGEVIPIPSIVLLVVVDLLRADIASDPRVPEGQPRMPSRSA